MEYVNVVGVQFRRAGRIYDFSSGSLDLKVGDDVVVETERGPSLAKVAEIKFTDPSHYKEQGLKPILRRAGRNETQKKGKLSEDHALTFAQEKIAFLKLNMRLLQAEVQFGGNKVILYFSAPGRVDFRELVKELASGLKARVELKQVGARDEAKLIGGMGVCGREYCCSSFLRDFVPVSIRMAKNQNLALNPSKVSGGCGRLLCCLTYENDAYTDLRKRMPPQGARVRFIPEDMIGDIIKADFLNQMVVIENENGQQLTVSVKDIAVIEARAPRAKDEEWGEDIDLEALGKLED